MWREWGLQPWRAESFKFSTDPAAGGQGPRRHRACTSTPRTRPWCCAWTRNPRPRRWNGPRRCCRCGPGSRKSAATITSGTAPPRCSPPWRSPPARSPTPATPGTGTRSSCKFLRQVAEGLPAPQTAHRGGQLRHPQPPGRPGLAGQAPPDHPALHADIGVLAESRWRSSSRSSPGRPSAAAASPRSKTSSPPSRHFIDGWNDRCHPFTWTKTSRRDTPALQAR